MIDVLADKADRIVVPKCSKCGMTEVANVAVFDYARRGYSGMYILPNNPIRNRYISSRIDPLLETIPMYREAVKQTTKAVHAKGEKTLFNKVWAFVGADKPTAFFEFVSDVNIYDEIDQIRRESLAYADNRTWASDADRSWKLGNPTFRSNPIWQAWLESDQKQWFVPCGHCGHQQVLDWFTHFVDQDDGGEWFLRHDSDGEPDASPVCEKCGGSCDRLAGGKWVAAHPGRDVSGYHVSRLFGWPGNDNRENPRAIVREMFSMFVKAQSNDSLLQNFYNNALGIPFSAEGTQITLELLEACMGQYTMPKGETGTYAGVDVGAVLHLQIEKRIGNIARKVFVGTVRDWNDLQVMCHRYGVTHGVVDAQPELHAAQEWCYQHSGWYRCWYSLGETSDKTTVVDHVERSIKVHRTTTLDASYARIATGAIELPVNWRSLDNGEYARQMCAATRAFDKDKNRMVWDEGNEPDHHQHADNYCRLAGESVGTASIVTI